MSITTSACNRRRFLKTAAGAGALLMAPHVVPGAALGKDGAVAPSERIVLGGIGIGNRGAYDLGCFLQEPDVRFVAVCDVKAVRREAVKNIANAKYGNKDCATYVDMNDLLARYLGKHRWRLDYARRLAEGRSIGSGQVEGACKHVIGRRLKQTGARWRVRRVNRMASLCCLVYSDHWNLYWASP